MQAICSATSTHRSLQISADYGRNLQPNSLPLASTINLQADSDIPKAHLQPLLGTCTATFAFRFLQRATAKTSASSHFQQLALPPPPAASRREMQPEHPLIFFASKLWFHSLPTDSCRKLQQSSTSRNFQQLGLPPPTADSCRKPQSMPTPTVHSMPTMCCSSLKLQILLENLSLNLHLQILEDSQFQTSTYKLWLHPSAPYLLSQTESTSSHGSFALFCSQIILPKQSS